MTVYGYARVSTNKQTLDEQISKLAEQGVERKNIYSEKFTGTTTERPQFEKLLKIVKAHDTIIVTKLDRFARNTKEALEAIDLLLNNDVTIKVLNLGTVENTPMGKMIVRTLLSVAEMERDMIVERTQAGKIYAKKHNPEYKEGRPRRRMTPQYKKAYEYSLNHSIKETATMTGLSVSTINRIRRQIKQEGMK